MKACPKCAVELPDEARFCGHCGERFGVEPKSQDGPAAAAPDASNSAFQLVAADYVRAFERVCEAEGLALPAMMPQDHTAYFEAAKAAGLEKLVTEKALHRVSIEKLPEDQRRALGIVLEDDIEPTGRSPWVPIIIAVNLIAAVVIAAVVMLQKDPPPRSAALLKPQSGTIDTGELETAFDVVASQARDCYRAALKSKKNGKSAHGKTEHPKREHGKNGVPKGQVVITLRIGLDGKASSPSLSVDELKLPGVATCILNAATTQTYPAAKNAPVDVDLPLTFAPGALR